MIINVLFFGITKDIASQPSCKIDLPEGSTLERLNEELQTRFPDMKEKATFKYAVNDDYCLNTDVILKEGDEIALIPPVSGG